MRIASQIKLDDSEPFKLMSKAIKIITVNFFGTFSPPKIEFISKCGYELEWTKKKAIHGLYFGNSIWDRKSLKLTSPANVVVVFRWAKNASIEHRSPTGDEKSGGRRQKLEVKLKTMLAGSSSFNQLDCLFGGSSLPCWIECLLKPHSNNSFGQTGNPIHSLALSLYIMIKQTALFTGEKTLPGFHPLESLCASRICAAPLRFTKHNNRRLDIYISSLTLISI